jgi:hypothetical protein
MPRKPLTMCLAYCEILMHEASALFGLKPRPIRPIGKACAIASKEPRLNQKKSTSKGAFWLHQFQ